MKFTTSLKSGFHCSGESDFPFAPMTDGVSPNGAFLSRAFTGRSNERPAPDPVPPRPGQAESEPAAPLEPRSQGTSSIREFNLLDLALRRFTQVLPHIDSVTTPVE